FKLDFAEWAAIISRGNLAGNDDDPAEPHGAATTVPRHGRRHLDIRGGASNKPAIVPHDDSIPEHLVAKHRDSVDIHDPGKHSARADQHPRRIRLTSRMSSHVWQLWKRGHDAHSS